MNPVRNLRQDFINIEQQKGISNGMKVLIISTDKNIFKEGSSARARMVEYGTLADELHIIVFTTRITNHESRIMEGKISENVWIYPTNSLSRWLYVFDAYKIAKRIIGNWKLEIGNCLITCQDPFEAGLSGWLVARHHKIPLQLQIHTDFLSPYFKQESFLNRIRVMLARFLIPRATRMRVVSERIKNSLVSHFRFHASRIDVFPIFIDTEKIRAARIKTDLRKKYPQFDFIALMASRFTREKNIGLAIEAMKEILTPKSSTLNPLLLIVGDGPERANYELRITNYGLQDNIIIENWTDDLVSYYKTADIFLITSNYEGYGRTVVEALSAGCPVIMTDVGIAGEIVKDGENGLVVPVGDAQALTHAIICVKEKRATLKMDFPPPLSQNEYLEHYKNTWIKCLKS